MGTCPDCSFDGTNGKTNENNQYPQGYAPERRIISDKEGRIVKNENGSPKWVTRSRCPLCGCVKKASSKPKTTKEIEV